MTRSAARRSSAEPVKFAILAVLLAGLIIGVSTFHRPLLEAAGVWVAGGQPTVSPTLFAETPTPSAVPPDDARLLGAGVVEAASVPTPVADLQRTTLAKRLAAVQGKGLGSTSGQVVNLTTGNTLWASRAAVPMIPASTMKLLTCLAALDVIGPDSTFETRVVSPAAGQLILVGGGDPYLQAKPATSYPNSGSTVELAKQVSAKLKAEEITSVTLAHDASLFSGPAWNPAWPAVYADQVTITSALWVDQGRATPTSPRSTQPAAQATALFGQQLTALGITVKIAATAATAPEGAEEVAAVSSLPVRTIVQEVLGRSDNSAAEVLLRQIAVAGGKPGSIKDGITALQQRMTALGVNLAANRFVDGSGLARTNRTTAATLSQVTELAAAQPQLHSLLRGLPVAGSTGTLTGRFYVDAAVPGKGWVRAKTGTLSKVSTLAGYTRTRDGELIGFAFMVNNPTEEWGARNWLDMMAGTVTACGCR